MTHDRSRSRLRLRRTPVVAVLVAVACIAGLGSASAARLHVGSTTYRDVASGVALVAVCDSSVTAALSDYQFQTTPQTWVAHSVTVGDVADACAGHPITVTTRDAAGATIATGSGIVGAAGATATTIQLGSMSPTTVARIDVVIA